MTKEETIRWLDSLKKDIGQSQHEELWHYAEALDVAIELLSTEAKTKCVAQIKVDTEEVVSRIKEEYDITDGWIPCSERLPSDSGDYLVWLEDESEHYAVIPFDADAEGFGWWQDYYHPVSLGFLDSEFIKAENVTAWQSLPKPYREDGES